MRKGIRGGNESVSSEKHISQRGTFWCKQNFGGKKAHERGGERWSSSSGRGWKISVPYARTRRWVLSMLVGADGGGISGGGDFHIGIMPTSTAKKVGQNRWKLMFTVKSEGLFLERGGRGKVSFFLEVGLVRGSGENSLCNDRWHGGEQP